MRTKPLNKQDIKFILSTAAYGLWIGVCTISAVIVLFALYGIAKAYLLG
jgi:hypothetical protein